MRSGKRGHAVGWFFSYGANPLGWEVLSPALLVGPRFYSPFLPSTVKGYRTKVYKTVVLMPEHNPHEPCPGSAGNLASIDIGSHTARLLIAEKAGHSELFHPLFRNRAYIRLAEDFEEGLIKQGAMDRALEALEDFLSTARRYNVDTIRAVCTGVVREASNKDRFLAMIREGAGIQVRLLSGEEEARLTGKGVCHGLNMKGRPFVIFDLGGGTTEFLFGQNEKTEVKSIPLGAMVLTQKYLRSDPPEEKGVRDLEKHIARILQDAFSSNTPVMENPLLVGTGGTVTTLAAMTQGIQADKIGADNIHGLVLEKGEIEGLFRRMSTITLEERLKIPGLDRGRGDIIVAGSMAVIGILRYFQSSRMVVSFSDILEGVLIECLTDSTA